MKTNWEYLTSHLQTGDIAGVKGRGFLPKLQTNFILPETDRFHFFLVGDYVKDDFVILESIGKGVAVGRLSWYKNNDVKFYRVNSPNSKKLGKQATEQATKWGRSRYDYRVYIWIFWQALKLFWGQITEEHSLRRIYITEFPQLPNDKRLLCTELVKEGYRGIFPILTTIMPAFPSAYEWSYQNDFINLVAHWRGEDVKTN